MERVRPKNITIPILGASLYPGFIRDAKQTMATRVLPSCRGVDIPVQDASGRKTIDSRPAPLVGGEEPAKEARGGCFECCVSSRPAQLSVRHSLLVLRLSSLAGCTERAPSHRLKTSACDSIVPFNTDVVRPRAEDGSLCTSVPYTAVRYEEASPSEPPPLVSKRLEDRSTASED